FDFGAILHDLAPELVALIELLEILLDDLPGVLAIEPVGPSLGKGDLDLAAGHLVLELGGAPAGAPVELQPVLHGEGLGLDVVREDAGMGNRIARTYEAVIGVLASRVDLLATEHGGRPGRIAVGLSWHLAHMAVLASDAGLPRRAV